MTMVIPKVCHGHTGSNEDENGTTKTIVIDISDSDNECDNTKDDIPVAAMTTSTTTTTARVSQVHTETTTTTDERSIPTCINTDTIHMFLSILPQYQYDDAVMYLRRTHGDIDEAIDVALQTTTTTSSTTTTSTTTIATTPPVMKDASDNDTTTEGISHVDEKNYTMQSKSTISTNIDDSNRYYRIHRTNYNKRQRPVAVHETHDVEEDYHDDTTTTHYIDTDFPPSSQSLNGRSVATTTTTTTTTDQSNGNDSIQCNCGYIATPKQVQSDGPNYGRFYLSCGYPIQLLKQQQQQQRSRDRNNNTNKYLSVPIKKYIKQDHCDQGDEKQQNNTNDDTQSIMSQGKIIINPYIKRMRTNNTCHHNTNNNNNDNTNTISNPTGDTGTIKRPCNFFQWDTTGVLGSTIIHNNNNKQNNQSPDRNNNNSSRTNHNSNLLQYISWYRFGMEQQCVLYHPKKYISVHDIRQGRVGNCWFLSALSVVSEQLYLIQRILSSHTSLNQYGCYTIHLFLDGKWQDIMIDSYLPVLFQPIQSSNSNNNNSKTSKITKCIKDCRHGIPVLIQRKQQLDTRVTSTTDITSLAVTSNTSNYLALPAFCATPDRQLWPALIEKAYAKAHGSYQQLSGGFIAEGLQDLTGAPCDTYIFDTDVLLNSTRDTIDMFWMKLLSFHTAGFVMGVATSNGGDGLVGGHAYSILDVIDIPNTMIGEQSKVTDYFTKSNNTNNGNSNSPEKHRVLSPNDYNTSIRLVRIRNPWGKREWKGDWSVSSDRWTNTLRKRLGTNTTYAKGDGTFYMSFDDMLHRFHHLDVAKTQKGWLHTSVDGMFLFDVDPLQSSKLIYELSVTQTTQVYISIIQPKKRSNTKNQYWYCDPSIIILRRRMNTNNDNNNNQQWECVATSLNGATRQCHLELFLEVGHIYVCVPWSFTVQHDHSFRLVTYSGSPVTVQSISCTEDSITDKSIRECTLKILLAELILSNDGSNVYPIIGPKKCNGMIIGTYGGNQSSFYVLAINASLDHYLSLRIIISNDVEDRKYIITSLDRAGKSLLLNHHQDFDIPPQSQKLLIVVTTSGTQKRDKMYKHPSFRYFSSWIAQQQKNSSTTKSSSKVYFGDSVTLCTAGQNSIMLHNSINAMEMSGSSGSIETSFESANMLLGRVAMLP